MPIRIVPPENTSLRSEFALLSIAILVPIGHEAKIHPDGPPKPKKLVRLLVRAPIRILLHYLNQGVCAGFTTAYSIVKR